MLLVGCWFQGLRCSLRRLLPGTFYKMIIHEKTIAERSTSAIIYDFFTALYSATLFFGNSVVVAFFVSLGC